MKYKTITGSSPGRSSGSAWAIIEDKSEVLFVRRSFTKGRGGQWCPPGGSIQPNELPEVACIREVFEETRLRVSIRYEIACFDTSHYFLCSLSSERNRLQLQELESTEAQWIQPDKLLSLGTIMDLRRIIPIIQFAGLTPPDIPNDLSLAKPLYRYHPPQRGDHSTNTTKENSTP